MIFLFSFFAVFSLLLKLEDLLYAEDEGILLWRCYIMLFMNYLTVHYFIK